MKFCPNCNTELDDGAVFCSNCGAHVAPDAEGASAKAQTPKTDNFDHTAEFDPNDISENKVVAMLVYLCGFFGIIIALIAGNSSPYALFHAKQAMKLVVTGGLAGIVTVLLCWTVIVPVAYVVFTVCLFVIKIVCFFQICKGKAIEPAIVRNLKFMK